MTKEDENGLKRLAAPACGDDPACGVVCVFGNFVRFEESEGNETNALCACVALKRCEIADGGEHTAQQHPPRGKEKGDKNVRTCCLRCICCTKGEHRERKRERAGEKRANTTARRR